MLELYAAKSCPFSEDMRAWLELTGREFVEYDVEQDPIARANVARITGQRLVPVLLEDGKPVRIGWNGRGCVI